MKSFPDVCPLCAEPLRPDPEPIDWHFSTRHPGRVADAFRKLDAKPFDFAYLSPEMGSRRWHVVLFDWPFAVVTIAPADFIIRWRGDSPVATT